MERNIFEKQRELNDRLNIQEMQSWSSLENVCWKGRLANGIGVHLDISVG